MTATEWAVLAGIPERTARWRAEQETHTAFLAGRLPHARRAKGRDGKECWWVHRHIDPILREASEPGIEREALSLRERFPDHAVSAALKKRYWLQAWRDRYQHRREGETERSIAAAIVKEAKRREGPTFKVAVSSLQLWHRLFRTQGLEGLIHGNTELGRGVAARTPEAADYFWECYRTPAQPSIRLCHDMTLFESKKQGWTWPKSYATTRAWVAETDDKGLSCALREGTATYSNRHLPHVEIDYSGTEPGEMFLSDHHRIDAFVREERGEKTFRPWLTTVIDARSRIVCGWHLGPTPHQDAILAALRMAFKNWALPTVLKIDNGRDYSSKLLTGQTKAERRDNELAECTDERFKGIAGELGITINFATPYSPWSKGIQERFYGTFEAQCGKSFATYCGRNAETKPECLAELRESEHVPTLSEAREAIGAWLDVYHREEHQFEHRREVPLKTWETATRIRRAVEHDLNFLMDSRGVYKVGGNGVGFVIAGKHLTYGERSHAIKRYSGRDVFITVDPADLSCCYAWTADPGKRTFIARLETNQRIPPHTAIDDAREVIAGKKREQSIMGKASRTARRRHVTFGQRLQEHTRERRKELLATGTDGKVSETCSIVPVRTGFEGASKPVQNVYKPLEPPDLSMDDFDDEPSPEDVPDDDFDMSDFDDPTKGRREVEDLLEVMEDDTPFKDFLP